MLSRRYFHFRLLGFCEIEDHRIVDALVAMLESKPFVRPEVRNNLELGSLDAGFFFGLSKCGRKTILSLFKMSLGEIPIISSPIEEKKFNTIRGAPKYNKAGNNLLL